MKHYIIKYMPFLLLVIVFASLIIKPPYADDVYFTSSPSFFVTEGQTYTYHPTANSVKGYPISFSFPQLPTWLSYTNQELIGETNTVGRYTITITVQDNHEGSEQQSYYVYVVASPTTTPSTTPTPTSTPSPTVINTSVTPTPDMTQNSQLVLYNQSPKDNEIIKDTSPYVTGTLKTDFPLDKINLKIYFDNIEVTSKVFLSTGPDGDSKFENTFTYHPQNLSVGTHTINLSIINPSGISIPESWSFNVDVVQTKSNTDVFTQLRNFFSKNFNGKSLFSLNNIFIALLTLGLLIFAIIVVKLIVKRPPTIVENKSIVTEEE